MPSVTRSVELRLPPEQAFALASDPARFEEWLTLHKAWPNGAPASIAPGVEFVQQISVMGMPAEVNWTVEAHEAPSRFVMRGSGPMGSELATIISATAAGDGTTVSYEAEFSGGGLIGPMSAMVTKKAGEELDVSLEQLKGLAG